MTSNEHILTVTKAHYVDSDVPSVYLNNTAKEQDEYALAYGIVKVKMIKSGEFYDVYFKDEASMVKYAVTML